MSFVELLREYEEIFADEQEEIEYDDAIDLEICYDIY
jgi:hypothetical protein